MVDDDDYEELNRYKWYALWSSGTRTYYAVRFSSRYNGKRMKISMHRKIMNPPKDMEVDHVNHDTLDNRKGNLRICTRSQNRMNREKQSNNTSGLKGVSRYKASGKWQAQIQVNGKHIHLSFFDDKLDAARAYNKAAKELFGEFALINNI